MWVCVLYGTRETAGAFWAQRQMSLASQQEQSGSRLLGVRPHLHGAMQFWTDRDLIVWGVGSSPCYCGRQQVRLAFWLQHLTSYLAPRESTKAAVSPAQRAVRHRSSSCPSNSQHPLYSIPFHSLQFSCGLYRTLQLALQMHFDSKLVTIETIYFGQITAGTQNKSPTQRVNITWLKTRLSVKENPI